MFGYVPPVARMQMSAPRPLTGASTAVERPFAARHWRRGLILDLDDTLYPRERFVRSGLAAVARAVHAQHGIAADAAYGVMTRALAHGGTGAELQALCDRFGLTRDLIPGLVQVFRTHTPTLFLPRDVADTLRRLRADAWGLAIVTNGLPSVQARKIVALDLASYVDTIIFAEEHSPGGKPSAAPFRAALGSLGLGVAQCVAVGDDAARDVKGARALGMPTVRVARAGVAVATDDEADIVIDSLPQLPTAAALLLRTVTADVA